MTTTAKSVTCACGRTFKNRLSFNPHARACPVERKRSEDFIARIERENRARREEQV